MFLLNTLLNSDKSIKSQATSFLIVGITLMTIVIGLVTATAVYYQSKNIMVNNAYQIAEGLAKQAVFPILSGDNDNARDALQQVLGFPSVTAVSLQLENMTPFIVQGLYPKEIPVIERYPDKTTTIFETDGYWQILTPVIIETDEQNEDNQFAMDPMQVNQPVIGYAEVIYSKQNLITSQKHIAITIASIGLLSILLLTLVLHIGLKHLFTPLAQLSRTMQKAEQSGEHILATVNGAKEIRGMANAYNSMMKVLDQQEDDLKSHRDELEQEVCLRTQELVEARDSALTASRHKSEFMANMSHELRTPIQSIIGYGELVTEELEHQGQFDLTQDMDKISRNSHKLLQMINSLLDLAKIEAGKIELNSTNLILAELKTSLFDTISVLSQVNNNQFTIELETSLTHILIDSAKLEQVLLNLLSNACKFTKNGHVKLTIKDMSNNIYFIIKDTGIGLSKSQQAFIFEEFRQVDASHSRQFSGTGLGLTISKKFVDVMQGSLSVKSELNQGATFIVALPLTSTEIKVAAVS